MKERILFIIFFIVNNLVISIISINKGYIFLKANNSFITLKIKGPGIQSIYYYDSEICYEKWNVKSFEFIPNEIYINSNKQNNISFQYYFNNSINNVKLLWYNNLNNLNCLFRECKNIIDIDLSNFNSSNINSMDSMFLDCQSLLSINFTNFKTSSVTNMATMFSGCISLVSLDLSYFDTSQVVQIQYMFNNSISLKYCER
jgi:surface protein